MTIFLDFRSNSIDLRVSDCLQLLDTELHHINNYYQTCISSLHAVLLGTAAACVIHNI